MSEDRLGDLAKDYYDLLIGALYPTTGEQFLERKYGLVESPWEVEPKPLKDIHREEQAMAAALAQVCQTS